MANSRVYHARQGVGWGPSVWREMVVELVQSRELVWRLFMRDFAARYRQSVLGILWALLLPLVAVTTFVFLNRSGMLNVGETGVPYPLYALLGLTVWQVFAGGLAAGSNAIVAGGSMVVKINFPKETLVISAMGQVIFELLVRLVLLAIAMAVFRVSPSWTAILFPLALLPLILFTLALGFFLALLNVLLRDVANMVTLATTFLMFLTPVVYPAPAEGTLAVIMRFNPLSGLVAAPRDLVVAGQLADPGGFAWSAVLSLVLLLISWRIFHLIEPRMAERV